MQQRYYDPVAGRFLSVDPVVTDANTGTDFGRYTYVNNTPYNHIDPNGMLPDGVLDKEGADVLAGKLTTGQCQQIQDARAAGAAIGIGITAAGEAVVMVGPALTEALARFTGKVLTGGAKLEGPAAKGAMARGREAGSRVLNELGLSKNTKAVSTAEGKSIPDALTDSLSVEIKDAATVSRTRQVRIQTEAARNSGRESVLVTGERTCVSGPCLGSYDRIIRRPDLGPQ